MRIGVLHGPNLDLLGSREPDVYGRVSLAEIDTRLAELGADLGVEVVTIQSNHEGELVDWVRDRTPDVAGWVVNAGGLTHTSVSLRDALSASGRPFVEVHLSNIFAREPYRRRSLLADAALGVVAGLGAQSYLLGLTGLIEHLSASR